jgi:hypothetical protein
MPAERETAPDLEASRELAVAIPYDFSILHDESEPARW